jgi:hypothetical protein
MGRDGESALEAAFSYSLADVTDPDFDVLSSIFHLLSKSKLQWKPVHVKCHQDDTLPFADLPKLAQLNVEMDRLTRAHVKRNLSQRLHVIPNEAWSIWYNGIKIPHKLTTPSTP